MENRAVQGQADDMGVLQIPYGSTILASIIMPGGQTYNLKMLSNPAFSLKEV